MLARLRFRIYRDLLGLVMWVSFRRQPVYPVAVPTDGAVDYEPYASAFPELPLPGVWHARTFPAWEHAGPRLRRIRLTRIGLAMLRWLAPDRTDPVPTEREAFLRAVYPAGFRRAWPDPPAVLEPVAQVLAQPRPDLVAELAVRGPLAWQLSAARDSAGAPIPGRYEVDLSWLLDLEPVDGLERPGGRALLVADGPRLRTVTIERGAGSGRGGAQPDELAVAATLSDEEFGRRQRLLLAGWNEALTTVRHNVFTHLAMLTSFAIASTNRLPADHPLRRLVHPCFQTLLVGNHEIATFQLSGPQAFAPRIFSHDHRQVLQLATRRLATFDVWDFEPETQFARRGTARTPFAYPYRDNVLTLWAATRDYTAGYLELYYDSDEALRRDGAVAAWLAELDRLLPGGVRLPATGPTRDWVARLAGTLIHVSTVEHDYENNVAWNYAPLGWVIPTVVPTSGQPMDRRRAFELIATYIGTWKRYNMLLSCDVPALAVDEAGRKLMHAWIDRLSGIQAEMASQAPQPWLAYPVNFNPSVSD